MDHVHTIKIESIIMSIDYGNTSGIGQLRGYIIVSVEKKKLHSLLLDLSIHCRVVKHCCSYLSYLINYLLQRKAMSKGDLVL